ncbi:MAG: peptidase [Planctomycetes bacterium]|nr:peptidase [Planctomycetota bacterium]
MLKRALVTALLVLAGPSRSALAQVPSPVEFLGHEVGADFRLCNYTDMVRYFRAIERGSDRMRLVDIGATSYGQRMLMAVISAPQNLQHIERLRTICQRLSKGRGIDDGAARAMAEEGRAFVWIDAGLHATEAIAGQNIIELVWQMNSRQDDEVRRILDEVVLLACPVNPDGYELIADAYRATRSMAIPVLYQRYVGHDNNRDFYACNQLEAQNVNRVFYRSWCPQIVYNHHQSAPRGTIIFTPPFRDPQNYYTDPMVTRGIEIVAAHINARFAHEGKPGVISRSGAPYSGWWNGGLRTTNYFHNVIGILTEVFGRPEPTPLTQPLNRRLSYGDYPDPVPSQLWHARQTIDYLQTANFAILDFAARHRRELLHGIWTMATRSIERGSRDHWTPTPSLVDAAEKRDDPDSAFRDPLLRDPRAYVLRRDQPDRAAASRLVRALGRCGVEVHRATAPFEVNGETVPQGSFVVQAAQAYRPHVLDMFEPQWHPDDIEDGKPVPPYDSAGWTLAMQMDVQVVRSRDALEGPFELVADTEVFEPGEVPEAKAGYRLSPHDSHTVIAINRLHAAACRVEWSPEGHYFVPRTEASRAVLAEVAAATGVPVIGVDRAAGEVSEQLRPARLGLFDVFGGSMATGWDQWILEEFGFPVRQVFGDRIERGGLRTDFDVLVFHTGLPGSRDLEAARRRREPPDLVKLREALPPFEDWSNLEARATPLTAAKVLPALREFVEQGGTLLALGGEVEKVIRHFGLPIEVGVHVAADQGERLATRDEFYVPGSLLAIEVDRGHRLGRGCSATMAAMVHRRATILEVDGEDPSIEVVARYRTDETLVSGWAIGEELLRNKAAVVSARVGQGRIVLYGADVTYRGQPVGTFKLLFNAILTAVGD